MIEVEVEDEGWRTVPGVEALTTTAAEAALISRPEGTISGDCTILLTGDAEVRELNARFRGKDAATNVLSFPAPGSAAPHLGDIALARGVCAGEAQAQGKPLAHHLSHLVVHGVLHLLGYDHAADAEAGVMEEMERTVLAGLGIGDPYDLPNSPPEPTDRADARP